MEFWEEATMSIQQQLLRGTSGFTLIEFAIALFTFSASFVVIFGLHSAAIERTMRERTQLELLNAARRLMATIETAPNEIEGTIKGSISDIQTRILGSASDTRESSIEATIVSAPWEIANLQTPMRRLTITIFDTKDSREHFRTTLLIGNDP